MPDSVRLAKRVAALARCSRSEAAQYIEGGWVTVDGHVVERPHCMVGDETVAIDPAARLEAVEPATLLLHAPIGFDPDAGIDAVLALARPDTRWAEDPSDVRMLQRNFHRLTPLVPLDLDASGLIVLTQDGRVRRRLTEDLAGLEQEFVVEVSGELAPYGLARLNHGLQYAGRSLPPCKVSWQSEARLRFAIKDVRRGQLRAMCAEVGLETTAIRRIRIGRIPLAKMPPGRWRYLPVGTRF
ncbi:RNA pseudouridine synthase [Luteimonas sp BLCC-B24]|uniref:RNA pseudouridine synthase n=1 Tax=Luteimonas sp. BLCC-B24 TaxID=3025317 RepID=UPI00234C83DE|nr:RNA pseudouridine synthase [Luteimonas sp. BLCC-B24]MDC7807167.1 RNA pseudouridine synthase [Luteimonas sp. BLCC-B24]